MYVDTGASEHALAKLYNVSRMCVHHILSYDSYNKNLSKRDLQLKIKVLKQKKINLNINDTKQRKVTSQTKKQIKRLLQMGMGVCKISRQLNIGRHTISKYVKILTQTAALVIMLLVGTGYAQTEPYYGNFRVTPIINISNQDPKQQELETQEKILAELRKLRQQVDGLQTQVNVTSETIEIYKKVEEARQIQIAALKSALEDTKKYDELATKKEELYKQEISLLTTEINRLNSALASEKRSKFFSKIGSALLTIGIAYAVTR